VQTDVNKLKRVERERNIAVIQARMAVLTARREFLQKLLFFRLDARDACKKARQVRGKLCAQVQSVGRECEQQGCRKRGENVVALVAGPNRSRIG
jgi:hypothetical protein